ncbi:MAG: hypothetical protein KDK24_01155 [Pseudooceanicola sp.]|nr:hypothetical protein [Pseudooceanicola sp.]
MPQSNNPLKPVGDIALKLKKRLTAMLKLWQKMFKNLLGFLKNLIGAIKKGLTQFIASVGKHVADGFLRAADKLIAAAAGLLADLREGVLGIDKVLDLIAKATDPRAVIARLKSFIKKLAQAVAALLARIIAFIAELNVIAPLLQTIDSFRAVLQLLFKWVAQVSGALSVVKTVRAMLKKALTEVKTTIKEVAEMMRELAAIPA